MTGTVGGSASGVDRFGRAGTGGGDRCGSTRTAEENCEAIGGSERRGGGGPPRAAGLSSSRRARCGALAEASSPNRSPRSAGFVGPLRPPGRDPGRVHATSFPLECRDGTRRADAAVRCTSCVEIQMPNDPARRRCERAAGGGPSNSHQAEETPAPEKAEAKPASEGDECLRQRDCRNGH